MYITSTILNCDDCNTTVCVYDNPSPSCNKQEEYVCVSVCASVQSVRHCRLTLKLLM